MRGGGKPWAIKEVWGYLSNHAAVGARVNLSNRKAVTLTQMDWRKVKQYVDGEKEKIEKKVGEREHEYKYMGQAVEVLVKTLRE